MVYLFVGQDPHRKDSQQSLKDLQLKSIKDEFLPKNLTHFNLDILHADSLSLKELQEKLSALPMGVHKRIVVIKNADELKPEIEDFILTWSKKDIKDMLLLLDVVKQDKKGSFLKQISKIAKVFRFEEKVTLSTFDLNRSIEERRTDHAIKLLEQLLKDGERPERVLGGLRYSLENSRKGLPEIKRKVRMLLDCDIEIKTGKFKPVFALERLVVKLCAFR